MKTSFALAKKKDVQLEILINDRHNGELEISDRYVELLTIFPDNSENTQQFLQFLDQNTKFIKIFPRGN